MSLVAYGSSGSEDEVENQDEVVSSTSTSIPQPTKGKKKSKKKTVSVEESASTSRKQREAVKITIPSLQQFKDEDAEPEHRQRPTFKGGIGLFSILPPPKYSGAAVTHNFMPHILTKQNPPNNPPPSTVVKETSNNEPDSTSIPVVEEDENDIGRGFDFFSLFPSIPPIPVLYPDEDDLPPPNVNDPLPNGPHPEEPEFPYEEPVMEENGIHGLPPAEEESFLNDEAFLKLKGKRRREEINIIDVNAADQLTGKDQWLMQSLTEERAERPSKRRHGMPTQQQKRKHQITYLAFQAKERELDLKNQWGMNNLTRRETQAKYGF